MAQSYGGVRWRDRNRFRFNGWNGIDPIISSGGNIGDAPPPLTPGDPIVSEGGSTIVTEGGDSVVTESH